MPNTVPANAQGLPAINRRHLLGGIAAVSTASAVAGGSVALVTSVEATAPMSAAERFQFHLEGLKAAAVELDPRIGSWNILRSEDDDLSCVLAISAHRVTGGYEGDGTYESGCPNIWGNRGTYAVALLPERIDGHRMFSVRNEMDRLMLAEPRLNTFIGRRVS
jgi:hypothetical protein